MAMSFSTSKGVVSTLIHILVDKGLLDYDTPVAEYWTEFAQEGKEAITVRDVLTHRAGLPRLTDVVDAGHRMLDWDHMVDALERARPCPHLVGRPSYHALTYGWLAGELIRRVTGKRIQRVLREELTEPLGLDGLCIGATAKEQKRAAVLGGHGAGAFGIGALIRAGGLLGGLRPLVGPIGFPLDLALLRESLLPPDGVGVYSDPRILDNPVPAANGLFTARSLARVYAMIAEGGVLDGVEVLSRARVSELSEVQTRERDRVLVFPMHWRLGYHSAFTTRGRVASGFGHFGYGGSGAWTDPQRRLSVAMINNRLGGGPFGDYRMAELGNAAMRGARMAVGAGETVTARLWDTAISSNPLLRIATSSLQG